MSYGFHRVVSPKGAVPQAADVVDNTPKILHPSETLVSVKKLNLDSTSMRELRENHKDIPARILKIVNTRGKMHNPVTNSGGVLLGNVIANGNVALPQSGEIVPLVSLSAIPLHLSSVKNIKGDSVCVEGTAVLFDSYPRVSIPEDFSPDLALSALDVSSIVPQVGRLLDFSDDGMYCYQTILIMGCGKAGITVAAAIRQFGGYITKIIAIDNSKRQLDIMENLGYATRSLENEHCLGLIDAQNTEEVYKFVGDMTKGRGADIVINCVNVPNTEVSAVLSAKEHGSVIFFSMATQFDKAALATDATGKDVSMVIGNGVARGQAELMFDLLRQDPKLRNYFESLVNHD